MFHSIRGVVTAIDMRHIRLAAGYGIEWHLSCSARAIVHWQQRSAAEPHEEQIVYTHLIPRDDRIDLYGYHSEAERELFLRLIKVNGVGAAVALNILSVLSVVEIERAIADGDHTLLSKVPKIGTKSAQKIVLALHGSITLTATAQKGARSDLVTAVVEMGYEESAVHKVVGDLGAELKEGDFSSARAYEEALFRAALQRLV